MKLHVASLAVLFLMLAATTAAAQVLYDDGPINGTTDAWTINFGLLVSDSFTLLNSSTVTGFNFGVWESPGDTLTSVDWSVNAEENAGTLFGSGTAKGANLTDQFISVNQYGYDIDKITVTGLNVNLGAGTYWLTLQNATVPSGDLVFWDENSGIDCRSSGCPSKASENSLGTLPAESFDINGSVNGGTVPEPGGFTLFGSGALGLAGMLRRKLL